MADEIDNASGGDTNPSFGKKESADPVVSESASSPSASSDATSQEPEPKVVKICKKCMISQSGVGGFCVNCGSELVPIRAVRDTYVGEVVGGKYKVVDRLGAGGMGEVYLGVNEPLGQQVAIKFLSKKFTADENIILRFLNEARSYCKVTHPNAVTLLEYGQHEDGALYLITEFIDGKSLSDTLKDVGPFPIDQLISISTQICEVLSAAHGQGVIHRDLKPDNIMLMPTSRGRYAVKVLDFGIAKIMDDDHASGAMMTETGSVFGTPEFMSPEQACGDDTDGRSDLYAAGIILFYLATGKLPFKGKNKLVVLHKQLHEAPPLPSEARPDIAVDPELERIILKCLRKAPMQRFQSADELLVALEAIDTSKVPATPRKNAPKNTFQDTNPDSPHDRDSIETVVQGKAALPDLGAPEPNDLLKPRATADVTELGDFSEEHEPSFAGIFSDEKSFDDVVEPHFLGSGVLGSDSLREKPDEEFYSASSSRSRNIFVGLGLLALLAGGAVWVYSNSGDIDSTDTGTGAPAEVDRVLLTGQVLGSLAAAQDSLRHADFKSAQRAVASTYQWVEDVDLPVDAQKDRINLSAKIEHLIELDSAFSSALGRGDCTRASRILKTMSGIESSLESARATALLNCKASTKSPIPATPSPEPQPASELEIPSTPTPEPPAMAEEAPRAPEVAPQEQPPPEPPAMVEEAPKAPEVAPPEQPTPEPLAPSEESNIEAPADDKPDSPETQESRLDGVMPDISNPNSPSDSAPPSAEAGDGDNQAEDKADEEEGEDEDDGFAMPPKTID